MSGQYELEREFHAKMVEVSQAERAAGRNPVRFEKMLAELGGVGTAKRLLQPRRAPHQGFTALKQRRRPELTVEYWVVRAPWNALFTKDELDCARRRLTEFESTSPAPRSSSIKS